MKTVKKFDYKENAAWRIFRIMGEFTEGFEFIAKLKNPVTIFGSTRFSSKNKWYKEAEKLGFLLSKNGFDVITGGGPGIMEAANKGAATDGEGESIGLNIQLPTEQRTNPYVEHSIAFHYFFTRKVCMSFSSVAYVFFPGGYGTMDELFELTMLTQTGKIEPVPIVVVGKDFYNPLIGYLKNRMVKGYKTIFPKELKLIKVVNSAEEAMRYLKKELKKR